MRHPPPPPPPPHQTAAAHPPASSQLRRATVPPARAALEEQGVWCKGSGARGLVQGRARCSQPQQPLGLRARACVHTSLPRDHLPGPAPLISAA
eukprot:1733462-Rhodomonas_salina.1